MKSAAITSHEGTLGYVLEERISRRPWSEKKDELPPIIGFIGLYNTYWNKSSLRTTIPCLYVQIFPTLPYKNSLNIKLTNPLLSPDFPPPL